MNAFRMFVYGIVAASFALVSSGCNQWNRRGDYGGYYRDGSSYDRNDRRWDGDYYRNRGYSRSDRRNWEWERD
jgi:hypothetical protein